MSALELLKVIVKQRFRFSTPKISLVFDGTVKERKKAQSMPNCLSQIRYKFDAHFGWEK